MIRVIIADDHMLVVESLRRILDSEEDIQCVGVANNGIEAINLARNLTPDVAILDVDMPDMDGIEATRQIKTEMPDTAVLVLTAYDHEEYVLACLEAGADYRLEYRLINQDSGQVRYVRDHGMPVKSDSGRLIMFDGILSDITEVKNLELELRQSRNFLSDLIMSATVPMLVLNKDDSVRYANPALENLTGFSLSEIEGCKPPYPWYANKHHYRRTDNQPNPREELYQKKNGNRFWVEISGVCESSGKMGHN